MHCLQTPIQKAFSLRKSGQTAVAWLDERGLIDEHVALGQRWYRDWLGDEARPFYVLNSRV